MQVFLAFASFKFTMRYSWLVCVVVLLLVLSVAQATDKKGKKFLKENAKKEGVVSLASGAHYSVCSFISC